jgi:hypothetical protein
VVQVALTNQQEHKQAHLSLLQVAPLQALELSTSPNLNQNTNRKLLAPSKDQPQVPREAQITRKITRNLRADTKKALSNTRSQEELKVIKSNNSSLTSKTCSRWTSLKCRSFLLMSYLCMVQTSPHKLEVHKLMHLVVSKHSLVLCKEVEEEEAVATKEATVVEVVVFKEATLVEVVATKTIIATPIIREALNYNNYQTYLASL